MSLSSALRAKTYILLVLMVCFGSVGNVLLSRGMKQIGQVRAWSAAELWRFFLWRSSLTL